MLHFRSNQHQVWQERCFEKSGLGENVGWLPVARLQQRVLKTCVSNLCGWNREKVDIEVLAMAAEVDFENRDAFENLQKHAEQCLEELICGHGRSSAIKKTENPKAEAVDSDRKKIRKAKEQEKTAKKKEADRMFDLTPSGLKALLPGAGTISGVFWMRFHPIKKFWRADYPIGAFVL